MSAQDVKFAKRMVLLIKVYMIAACVSLFFIMNMNVIDWAFSVAVFYLIVEGVILLTLRITPWVQRRF